MSNAHATTSTATTARRRDAVRRKLVIVGDGACGKTSLLSVFTLGYFPKEYIPTVFENYVTDVRIDGIPVHLALWDTAGQEEFDRLRPLSYSKANVILIAFAIDTPDSLDNVLAKWIQEVNQMCPDAPVILVGLKKDLRQRKRSTMAPTLGIANPAARASDTSLDLQANRAPTQESARPVEDDDDILDGFVRPDQAEKIAKEIGARKYLECSALTGEGVDDVFESATRAALLRRDDVQEKDRGCCAIL